MSRENEPVGPVTEDGLTEPAVIHTGSISSTVDLDFVHNEAHKVYHPSRKVRLLYWLAFQAPFPYVANHAALEAARQRRIIVDILTKYWFGHHLVADVIDIQDVPGGGHDFVTELVRGHEPEKKRRAWQFLKQINRHFLDSGLPTWQVTPYNPHAITNFIERPDGSFRIIDLESSLVAVLYPVSRLPRLIRAGLFPSFDDIDVETMRRYVAAHAGAIRLAVGDEYDTLLAAIDRYDAEAATWHASEPRVLNRGLRAIVRAVESPFRRARA